jgi:hypothetical protein
MDEGERAIVDVGDDPKLGVDEAIGMRDADAGGDGRRVGRMPSRCGRGRHGR